MRWPTDPDSFNVKPRKVSPIQFLMEEAWGEKEIVGERDNPLIIRMFNDLGYNGEELKDETAWCAAFANWGLKMTGHQFTGKLNARSFLDLPGEVEEPQFGDLVIYWRESPDSWKGHVAFFVRHKGGWDYVFGGNQNNEATIKAYSHKRRLGIRRPMEIWI